MSTRTAKSGRRNQASASTFGSKGKGGKKGRKPAAPVKVGKDRNWGPILMFVAVGAIAAGIIGYAAWASMDAGKPWPERAAEINGIVNYRESKPEIVGEEYRRHASGPQEYETDPPTYGTHADSPLWQNCEGDVYDAPIANEHAVHSLEHGAVWVTYDPALPADQVERLADKVRGNDYLMMSPYEGLDAPISLQTWGYQLKVDDAGDGRIDDFIRALRRDSAIEAGATCSGGVTTTGTVPIG